MKWLREVVFAWSEDLSSVTWLLNSGRVSFSAYYVAIVESIQFSKVASFIL